MTKPARKWYRHSVTGLVASIHPRVASADSHLVEVPEGTKPLAYMPIPQAAIDELLGREPVWASAAGDADLPENDPEADAPAENDEE